MYTSIWRGVGPMSGGAERADGIVHLFHRALPPEFTFFVLALKTFLSNDQLILLLGTLLAIYMYRYASAVMKIEGNIRCILFAATCMSWLVLIEETPVDDFLNNFVFKSIDDHADWVRLFVACIIIINVVVVGAFPGSQEPSKTDQNNSTPMNPTVGKA